MGILWGHAVPHNAQPVSFCFCPCPCPQLPTALPSASSLSALQNLLGAKNYQFALRKTVPTPKKMTVSCP